MAQTIRKTVDKKTGSNDRAEALALEFARRAKPGDAPKSVARKASQKAMPKEPWDGLRCPHCGEPRHMIYQTYKENGGARRVRVCPNRHRFDTFESRTEDRIVSDEEASEIALLALDLPVKPMDLMLAAMRLRDPAHSMLSGDANAHARMLEDMATHLREWEESMRATIPELK